MNEDDIRIEESALDVEWLEQPRLMLKYGTISAEQKLILDKAKDKLELTKAELDKEIRNDPGAFGITKITEAAVNSAILTDPRYINAQQHYNQCQYQFNISRHTCQAIDQRKDALENMVKLHGMQYFAGPRVPRDLAREVEQKKVKEKETHAKIGKHMPSGWEDVG